MTTATLLRNPTRVWRSRNRNMNVPIEEMDTEYLKNCIAMISRGHDLRGRRIGSEQSDKLMWLVEELAHRNETEGWDA